MNIKKPRTNKNSKKSHKCDICEKAFPSQSNLKQHVSLVHNVVKNFTCDKCETCFSSQDYLNRHIHIVHGERLIKFKCDYCEKDTAARKIGVTSTLVLSKNLFDSF